MKRLCFYILVVSLICSTSSKDLSVDAIYYESPPYLYKVNGKFHGMVPQIIKRAKQLCKMDINLAVNTNTVENLTGLMKENSTRRQHLNNKIWIALAIEDIPQEQLNKYNLTELILFNTEGLEVVVHRDQIGILPKIAKGVFGCRHFFALIFIMAAGCGVLIWACERFNNPEFSKCFRGSLTGFWFCLVTMTTVGYGDVAPRSLAGRGITMGWMMAGLIIVAIIISTITEAVTGSAYLDIYQEHVVAKKNSMDAFIAKEDYKAKLKLVDTNTELLNQIATRHFFAGVMNTDLYMHLQDEIRESKDREPLRSVYHIKHAIPIRMYIPAMQSDWIEYFHKCFRGKEDSVVTQSVYKFRSYVKRDTLDMNEPLHLFIARNKSILGATMCTIALIVMGLIFEVIYHIKLTRNLHQTALRQEANGSLKSDTMTLIEQPAQKADQNQMDTMQAQMNHLTLTVMAMNETLKKLTTTVDNKKKLKKALFN